MNLLEFFRLILRYWKVLVIFPLLTAGIVFILTRNTKREYTSSTQVYTGIASGYGITSGEDDRVDYFAVNNAFDNLMATIKSRETIEEVGMRLLAHHLLIDKPSYNILAQDNFDHLKEIIPEKLKRQLVVKGSLELTFFRVESYRRKSEKNEIVEILNDEREIYSFENISSKMGAMRKQSSDMIEINFKGNDPAVCQQTLQYIVDVVIQRYKGIKGSETNNVVKYFEDQLALEAAKLRKSEDKLLAYSSQNKIINYYEQAKFVAESKEDVTMDLQKSQMSLEASKAALFKIEQKLNLKKDELEIDDNIVKLRQQLSEISFNLANAEIYNEDASKKDQYQKESNRIKGLIHDEVDKLYKFNNTTEGVPRGNILNDWLSNFIAVDENTAKVAVIKKRLDGFDSIFNNLAPIGSNLKRIEREVDVEEKEYLSVLHGLNLAKLRQQSLEMSNNLTITDAPFLPLEPLPSKRIMMVIMAFIATFIVTLASIVAKSLLGKTIQSPGRAEKFTGLQFIGAFPDYDKLKKHIIIEKLDEANHAQLSSNIKVHLKSTEKKANEPYIITVGSTKKGEGKSYCIEKISKALAQREGKVLWLNMNANETTEQNDVTIKPFADDHSFMKATSLSQWFKEENITVDKFAFVIIELSEFNKYCLPEGILLSSMLNLFILDSERVWSESDSRSLGNFTKTAFGKNFVILNKIDLDRMENIIGEIPKTRSNFRRIVKSIISFDFKRA